MNSRPNKFHLFHSDFLLNMSLHKKPFSIDQKPVASSISPEPWQTPWKDDVIVRCMDGKLLLNVSMSFIFC